MTTDESRITSQNTKSSQDEAPVATSCGVMPDVTLHRNTLGMALRLAEQAVDDINMKLREAEQVRDDFARRLGSQQGLVDQLTVEREYRSRHVRSLMVARDN